MKDYKYSVELEPISTRVFIKIPLCEWIKDEHTFGIRSIYENLSDYVIPDWTNEFKSFINIIGSNIDGFCQTVSIIPNLVDNNLEALYYDVYNTNIEEIENIAYNFANGKFTNGTIAPLKNKAKLY